MATVPNPVDTTVIKDSSTRSSVAIWNNYDTCGTMTRADVGLAETADLDDIFTASSAAEMGKTTARYRDMESLLVTQMELKTCGGRQYGMYDWLMSSATSMGANLTQRKVSGGVSEIEPFILAAQKDVIKDDYWLVSHILNYQYKYELHATPESNSTPSSAVDPLNGSGNGFSVVTPAAGHVIVRVTAAGNNPNALGYFPVGSVVNLFAKGGADQTSPAYRVALEVVEAIQDTGATGVELLCTFQGGWGGGADITSTSFGTTLGAGKVLSLISKYQSPAADNANTGVGSKAVLTIGANNVSDFESWCNNRPALNTLKHVPFWYQTSRHTLCVSEFYKEWLERMMRTNAYFNKFGDVSIAERNAQLGLMFQKEWCNSFFFGQPLSDKQKLTTYKELPLISSVATSSNDWSSDVEGAPISYRANALGVYRQLADTGRVQDKAGAVFNLKTFLEEDIFNLVRSRKDQGKPADSVDVFTDSKTAKNIFNAMMKYYVNESGGSNGTGGALRLNYDVTNKNISNLGFYANSFRLHYPAGVTLNVITNEFFDDLVTVHKDAEVNLSATGGAEGSMGRFLMVLDLGGGIYPGVIASNRVVHKTGDLADLAKSDSSYNCVMNNPTKETTLNSLTWTAIVECPSDNLIVENFRDEAMTI